MGRQQPPTTIKKRNRKKLLEHNQIINDLPLTQIMFLTSLSNFANETEML